MFSVRKFFGFDTTVAIGRRAYQLIFGASEQDKIALNIYEAAQNGTLVNYGRYFYDRHLGNIETLVSATNVSKSQKLDYRTKVLFLEDGKKVKTKSNTVYTRKMGPHGERIYTDSQGNVTTFNGVINRHSEVGESSIYRISPNGASFCLNFSNQKSKGNRGYQIISRWVTSGPGGFSQMQEIGINPKGKITSTRFDMMLGGFDMPVCMSSSEIMFGDKQKWSHKAQGWQKRMGAKLAPMPWTSLKDFPLV